jgi:hypothetical protein
MIRIPLAKFDINTMFLNGCLLPDFSKEKNVYVTKNLRRVMQVYGFTQKIILRRQPSFECKHG